MGDGNYCLCGIGPYSPCPMCVSRGDHLVDKLADFRAHQQELRRREDKQAMWLRLNDKTERE